MENEKSISWLQFSDLHILKSVDWNLMMDSYRSLAERLHPDFIVITGDYRHKKYEENYDYSETLEFLKEITKLFSVKKKMFFWCRAIMMLKIMNSVRILLEGL